MQFQDAQRRQVHLLTLLRATDWSQCSHSPETATFTHNVLYYSFGALLLNKMLVICDALSKTVGLFLDFGQFITVVSFFLQCVLLFDNVK